MARRCISLITYLSKLQDADCVAELVLTRLHGVILPAITFSSPVDCEQS